MTRWQLYQAPSAQYAFTRVWIFAAVGAVMIIVGSVLTNGALSLVGFIFCLFALWWLWLARLAGAHSPRDDV